MIRTLISEKTKAPTTKSAFVTARQTVQSGLPQVDPAGQDLAFVGDIIEEQSSNVGEHKAQPNECDLLNQLTVMETRRILSKLLTILGARFVGKSRTSQFQNGPRMYLLTTDLSMPEYL